MKQPAALRSGAARGRRQASDARRGAAGVDRVGFNANPLLAVKVPAWRSKLTLFMLFCAFAALAARAIYLQGGVSTKFLQRQGEVRYARTLDVPATRGRVVDRNGVVLAASVPAKAIWAIPDDVDATPKQLAQLAQQLQMSPTDLRRRLSGEERKFVYLRRQVDLDVAQKIAELKLAGIHDSREFKRHYPESGTTAHLIGFTNVEDRGQEGVELALDATLSGRTGHRRVIKDRLGRIVEDDWLLDPVDGRDVVLSIDNRIQYLAHAALNAALTANRARAGSAIVLDIRSGEVLALVNLPTYDPNRRATWSPDALRNRVVTDTFEPGSTLKPFSVATAIDAGRVTPQTRIQTAPGRMTIGDRTIGDAHPHGLLTVEEVVAKSSNVGTAKIALDLPGQLLWDTYTGVGFGQAPRIGFQGVVAGRLRPYKAWRPIEQATIAYGYGVSVSLLQLARAYSVFARDGDLIPVSLVKIGAPAAGVPVLKPETARAMRHMLELAVSDEGTAPAARIAGYRTAGKTGTARKLRNGRYTNAYIASFAGFAPVSDPRVVVAVMIDEPSGGTYYGGQVAAPVFAQVVAGTLRTLQVAPDAPMATPKLPAQPLPEVM